MITRELDNMAGFRIGGTVIYNLRCAYVYDTVITAESEEKLKSFINGNR